MVLAKSQFDLEHMLDEEEVKTLFQSRSAFSFSNSIFESMYMPREFASKCVELQWISADQEQDLVNSIALLKTWNDKVEDIRDVFAQKHFLTNVDKVFFRVLQAVFEPKSVYEWFNAQEGISFLCRASKVYLALSDEEKQVMCRMFKVKLPVPQFLFDTEMENAFKSEPVNAMWLKLCSHQCPYLVTDTTKWNKQNAPKNILKSMQNSR